MKNILIQITAFVQGLLDKQRHVKMHDFYRKITCVAGQSDSVTIPLNDMGAFHQIGYNIAHTAQEDGTSPVKIRFRSKGDNAGQSNDLIPIELISTPGAPGLPRYGMRKFEWTYPANDVMEIEWDAREATEDIEIKLLVTGELFFGVKTK